MRKILFVLGQILFCVLVSASCSNILSQTAKTTDDSLLQDAQDDINAKNYSDAIAKFKLMSSSYLTDRNVIAVEASAYAGACGLDMIGLVNTISTLGSTTLLKALYSNAVGGTATQETACETAQSLILGISTTPASRTAGENLLLAFSAFRNIGVILGQFADQGGTGKVDSAFSPCNTTKGTAPAATGLPVASAQQLSLSLMLAINALGAVTISSLGSETTVLASVCTTFANPVLTALVPSLGNPCTQTTASSFTDIQLSVLMGVVNTSTIGIGSCTDTTYVTCICNPYP